MRQQSAGTSVRQVAHALAARMEVLGKAASIAGVSGSWIVPQLPVDGSRSPIGRPVAGMAGENPDSLLLAHRIGWMRGH